jgi:hypothetical protein
MVIAIVLSVAVMMFAARPIGEYVEAHPTIKMLALSFLVLVGVTLIAEGFETHVPKGTSTSRWRSRSRSRCSTSACASAAKASGGRSSFASARRARATTPSRATADRAPASSL